MNRSSSPRRVELIARPARLRNMIGSIDGYCLPIQEKRRAMNIIRLAAAGLVAAIAVSGIAVAHDGAMGIVKTRMEMMKDVGASMKLIGAMVKGEAAFDAAKVEEAANTIAKHAGHIPKIFPEGSLDKPTEALPVIWTRWDDFTRIGKEMETAAQALAEAAKTAGEAKDIVPQLGAVGQTCKSCHQDFRLAK
jgi:cytochrome c556